MRLLHLNDRLSARGGADQHLLAVLDALVERGNDVTLIVGRDDGTAAAPCPVRIEPNFPAERPPADVVHIHNVMDPRVIALGDVMTVQDHRTFCPGRGKLTLSGEVCRDRFSEAVCSACFTDEDYFARITALTRARVDALAGLRLIVLSRYMRDELGQLGLDSTVIPPFVHDLDRTAEPNGPPCVLFVGRVVDAKGVADAVEAWRRSGVDLPLAVAGTGRARTAIENDGVEVLGWVGRRELAALYRRAAAVILPSRWQEPFGIVGLEALTMGTPVVAWDSGGVSEWHPGPLVRWGDVDGLADALRTAARPAAAPTGFERGPLMDRLEALYDTVLLERRGR